MLQKLLNKYESITYNKIFEVLKSNNAKAFAKVRIADVIPLNQYSFTDNEFKFALMAHFDFIITKEDTIPLFAIEFDGPSHSKKIQIERDMKKNSICQKANFPILRINSNYLQEKYRKLDILTYLIEFWFLAEGFYEAQSKGYIPYDEIFDPAFIVYAPGYKNNFPFWLSLEIKNKIKKLYENKSIYDPSISSYVGIDADENYRCMSYILITRDYGVFVLTGMRKQLFPAYFSELIYEISCFDLYDKLIKVKTGELYPISRTVIYNNLKAIRSKTKLAMSSFVSDGTEEKA